MRRRISHYLILLGALLMSYSSFGQVDEEIQFVDKTGEITLAGTITKPESIDPTHLVVLLPVAGPTDRDLTLIHHKYYKALADGLAVRGIASLRFDDRGVGKSNGKFNETDLNERVQDACIAYQLLIDKFPGVDKSGFIGMSEGSGISVLASGLCADASFLVLLSAPVRDGKIEMTDQMNRLVNLSSFSEDDKQKIKEKAMYFLDLVSADSPSNNRDKILELLKGPYGQIILPPYAFVPSAPEEKTDFVLSPWYQSQLNYSIKEELKEVSIPSLALYGNLDKAIDANANLESMKKLAPEIQVEMLDSINHLMQHAKTGLPLEYAYLPESFSGEVIERIVEWVLER